MADKPDAATHIHLLKSALMVARPYIESAYEEALFQGNKSAGRHKEKLDLIDAAIKYGTAKPGGSDG